jgi:hypothetical protein
MRRWAELTSFLVGTAAALVLLAGWRVPSAHVNPRTALKVRVAASRAVEVSKPGTVLDVRGFRRAFAITVVLRNPRHGDLHLRPRLQVQGDRRVAEAVQARLTAAGGEQLFEGPAERLSQNTARRLWLDPHGGATAVTLRLTLPRGEAGKAAARAAVLTLLFEVDP